MMEKEELCSFALSIATSSPLLMVLKAIIELDVMGIINRAGPGAHLSPAQIAAQLPTKDPGATASMLDRMLRVLANNSILSCSLRALPNDGPIERGYMGLPPFASSSPSLKILVLWFFYIKTRSTQIPGIFLTHL